MERSLQIHVIYGALIPKGGVILKKRTVLVVAGLLLAGSVAFAGGNVENRSQSAAQRAPVAARVNGVEITVEEYEQMLASNIERYEAEAQAPFPEDQRSMLERRVLDGLITRATLEAETQRLGITVASDEIEAVLEQFRGQFPDRDTFMSVLQQQGYTEERFEAELQRQMAIEQLFEQEVFAGITVEENELQEFYDENTMYFEQPEQVSARHIILTTQGAENDTARNAIRQELEGLRRRIVGGEDFADVAQQYSQDGSASSGGSLGTFGRGQMVPAFEEVAFSLPVGELSQIVETQFGYHLVEVTERIPARTIPYPEVRGQIEDFLLEDIRNRAAEEYVEELRSQASVEELISIN